MMGGSTRLGSREILVALGLGVLAASVVAGVDARAVAPVVALFAVLVAGHETLLTWRNLLAFVIGVVWFVPIRIYTLPAGLPFDLELYRIVVAAVLAAWFASLLVDTRVRLQRSVLDPPLVLLLGAVIGSELTNPGRVSTLGSDVAKSLMFLLSFILVYYFVLSVVRDRAAIERVVRVLTVCGIIVAFSAVVERRTGYNVFHHLQSFARFLEYHAPLGDERGGHPRAFGSSQDPIAFGAALAMMVPLSIYLAYTSSRRWWLGTVVLLLGIMSTASRTAVVMVVVAAAVLFWLRRDDVVRLWPALVPLVVVIHFATPGAIGTFRYLFNPPGGIVNEQTRLAQNANPLLAGGRLRVIGPSLDEASRRPLFGEGWGTRLTGFDTPNRNAPILDDAWLGTLLEIGGVGVAAFIWLMVRAVRMLARAAKASADDSRLYAALAAAIAAFGVGMATYDAFSFIQVAFLFWLLLAVAAAAIRLAPATAPARPQAVRPVD
jgi:hypothetical protein